MQKEIAPQSGFLIMKKLIISLLVSFAIPVFASEPYAELPEVYANQFIVATNVPLVEKFDPCSCVSYGKWKMGVSQSIKWGNANQIVPNSLNPALQGIVILNEGRYSHIAHYRLNGAFLSLDEYNYLPCEYSEREIPLDYPLIKGYLNL